MTDTLIIRRATIADLHALSALERSHYGDLGYPLFVIRQFIDALGPFFLVGERRGRLLGYALGSAVRDDTDEGWILSLLVNKESRGQGLGRRLMGALMEALATAGVRNLRLTVSPKNESGVSLYKSLGFAMLEKKHDYLGPGEDRLLMAAVLGSP